MAHPARAANKRRVRARRALESHTNVVAFQRTADSHTVAANPNKGKRHAARMANDPRETFRQYSPGAPASKESRFRYIEQTRNGRTLPLSKRVQRFETVKDGPNPS